MRSQVTLLLTRPGDLGNIIQEVDGCSFVSSFQGALYLLSLICCSYCLDSSLNSSKVSGKVLVCRHADSSADSKLAKSVVVKAAGGVGMILVDEQDKDVAIPFVIPAATVGTRAGNLILSYINNTRFIPY